MDEIGIFLDDGGRIRNVMADGTVRESAAPTERGRVIFQPRGVVHSEEALQDGTRAIAIELRDTLVSTNTSPPKLPDGAVLRLENSRLLAWEFDWPTNQARLVLDNAHDAIIVPLESGAIRLTRNDGAPVPLTLAFGQPLLLQPASRVRVEAVAGTPRIVVVQLK